MYSYLVSLKRIQLLLKVGKRLVCAFLSAEQPQQLFFFFFSKEQLTPTETDGETLNPLLCSSLHNPQPRNVEWKKLV